jgi:hypothetical protein
MAQPEQAPTGVAQPVPFETPSGDLAEDSDDEMLPSPEDDNEDEVSCIKGDAGVSLTPPACPERPTHGQACDIEVLRCIYTSPSTSAADAGVATEAGASGLGVETGPDAGPDDPPAPNAAGTDAAAPNAAEPDAAATVNTTMRLDGSMALDAGAAGDAAPVEGITMSDPTPSRSYTTMCDHERTDTERLDAGDCVDVFECSSGQWNALGRSCPDETMCATRNSPAHCPVAMPVEAAPCDLASTESCVYSPIGESGLQYTIFECPCGRWVKTGEGVTKVP